TVRTWDSPCSARDMASDKVPSGRVSRAHRKRITTRNTPAQKKDDNMLTRKMLVTMRLSVDLLRTTTTWPRYSSVGATTSNGVSERAVPTGATKRQASSLSLSR